MLYQDACSLFSISVLRVSFIGGWNLLFLELFYYMCILLYTASQFLHFRYEKWKIKSCAVQHNTYLEVFIQWLNFILVFLLQMFQHFPHIKIMVSYFFLINYFFMPILDPPSLSMAVIFIWPWFGVQNIHSIFWSIVEKLLEN